MLEDSYTYLSPSAKRFPVTIVYEDNHLLFAEKPAGLLSQEDSTGQPDILSITKEYLVSKYKKPGNAWLGLVHRLDQVVSGLMVFAKTSKAASRLSNLIRKNEIEKTYCAIVHGVVKNKTGTWVDRLSSEKREGRYYIDSCNGKLSKLHYEVISTNTMNNLSLLEINLITGRAHQIRVQTSTREHPIVGDRRYGRLNDDLDKRTEFPLLFSQSLKFIHPVKNTELHIKLPLPNYGLWELFGENCINR